MKIPPEGLKLNIGCGGKVIEGWTGVDAVKRPGADIVADCKAIPLPSGCANELMAIHLVEHVYSWEVPAILKEWFRLLRPGGLLVLEMPDIVKAAKNIAEDFRGGKHPDQQQLWAIFGDDRTKDPLMIHKAGWWFDRLRPVVADAAFVDIVERPTVFHPVGRERRDFRLEARKP